jgi:hypothetical protein
MFSRVLRKSADTARLYYDQHYQSIADHFKVIARERPSPSVVTEILLELKRPHSPLEKDLALTTALRPTCQNTLFSGRYNESSKSYVRKSE